MFYGFGQRQHALLEALLFQKNGLTIDELASKLGITRTAVQQHALTLKQGGYIEKGNLTNTGGRPGQVYVLSKNGIELFPKQYSWLAELLLKSIKDQLGSPGFEEKLKEIGKGLAQNLKPKLQGLSLIEKMQEVSNIMQTLGYKTELELKDGEELPVLKAHNCIYHHLAQDFEEVCQLDCALLESLLDKEIEHEECMVRDGDVCKFKIK
ncbi:MAG: HTH domain-containing protein [Nitrospina sp.]|jgi:predicted ArsR family transcriptional regulator|nr:HTH domain-containing protein [Nitrospina sp.]MBT6717153.1 HTH domain-containing protein [Nitrospina sp.]